MSEFISVIIPTYNRAHLILRAIDSVRNQSYKNYELIVVDDGSTDQTEEVLRWHIENQVIKYIKQTNNGVAHARNKGASLAKGEWLSFLDSDDEWHTEKLQKQMAFLGENPQLKIAYTDEVWIRNDRRVNQKKSHQKFGGQIFEYCLNQCFIAPSSVIIHRDQFIEMKGFDETFIVCEDYDLWLKVSSTYEIGFLSQALITKYGGHEDQLSTKYFAMDKWRLLSMKNILELKKLSSMQIELVKKAMLAKGTILLNGYLKHGHLAEAESTKAILDKLIVQ